MNSLGEVLIFLHDWCLMLLGSNLYPGVLTAVVQQVDLAVPAWVRLLAFTQTSWYSRHNFDPLQIFSIWLNSNKATWIGKDLKWQDNTTARVSNFCKEGGTSGETGNHWGPTNPHWIPPTIPIYSFLPYVYKSTMYNTNSSSIPHVWHVPCHEISLLLPASCVFWSDTSVFHKLVHLFPCRSANSHQSGNCCTIKSCEGTVL